MNTRTLNKMIVETLDDNKAINITALDVRHLTDITDDIIICSATSKRHAATLADKVIQLSKKNGVRPLGVEGEIEGEWILIDLYETIIHIMLPEMREFYAIEKLWSMTEKTRQHHEN